MFWCGAGYRYEPLEGLSVHSMPHLTKQSTNRERVAQGSSVTRSLGSTASHVQRTWAAGASGAEPLAGCRFQCLSVGFDKSPLTHPCNLLTKKKKKKKKNAVLPWRPVATSLTCAFAVCPALCRRCPQGLVGTVLGAVVPQQYTVPGHRYTVLCPTLPAPPGCVGAL